MIKAYFCSLCKFFLREFAIDANLLDIALATDGKAAAGLGERQ
jgi:hypothetical protein